MNEKQDGMMTLGSTIAESINRSARLLDLLDPHWAQEATDKVQIDPIAPLEKMNKYLDDLAALNDRLARMEQKLGALLERI